ncbi:MAG: phosphoribosyltransferase family protein [Pseudomonadales bacterium]|nr:phosphoribosyltransferase family protein [Pseudomonadales bacterium]
MKKKYISAQDLLDDSWLLALNIIDSGFQPDLIIGVWRGGTPVGIAIQEALAFAGINCDHMAIRTESYTGIGTRTDVKVHGLDYIARALKPAQALLLVDDVYDTGLSLAEVCRQLAAIYGDELPAIRMATPYFKPANNKTSRAPDYCLHTTDQWLVFPHELLGLSDQEIASEKPGIDTVRRRLLALRNTVNKR